jgi:hypothetical protein
VKQWKDGHRKECARFQEKRKEAGVGAVVVATVIRQRRGRRRRGAAGE